MIPALKRAIASVVTIWFLASAVAPGLCGQCPVHNGGGATVALASHAHHAVHPSPQQSKHKHAHCTCVGQCCPPTVARVADAITLEAPTSVASGRANFAVRAATPGKPVARLQLTTGPPRIVDRTT